MKQKIIFLSITIFFALTGCKNKNENHADHDSGTYYTCPMHPSVRSNKLGSCPVCNMSLIKVEKQSSKEHTQHKGNFITIEKKQQQLAGIKTDTVKFQTIIPASTILGKVNIDEELVTTISSRVKGRIDKLYIKTSGEYIQKGNPVYAIYSEQLFADEKEFIALSKKRRDNIENELLNNLFLASKNKLLLWGLTEKQIDELEENKSASQQIIFYAQTEGYVTEILVKEGVYVDVGALLIKLTKLNQVWIDAQVYSNEIEKINNSNSFQIFSETYPDETYTGHLVFSNPSLEDNSKTLLLRLRVDNQKNKLIPGMMVYINLKRESKLVLAIPKSALLLSEKMKIVWVLMHDNTFEQRMIETGEEGRFWIEVLSKLQEGEIVVTEGSYLINSEFILKSGVKQKHQH
ncbi:MAG: efflux RND transporter periplasmic adaptor subunit [Raineya sp.]|nr:efflux RND transporter periplasmic adaptor subunit [Raineya sp.]